MKSVRIFPSNFLFLIPINTLTSGITPDEGYTYRNVGYFLAKGRHILSVSLPLHTRQNELILNLGKRVTSESFSILCIPDLAI